MALCLTASCASYEPQPLDPRAILERVDVARRTPAPEDAPVVDHAQALRWLVEQSPDVQEVLATWRTAHERARIPTPWPNPTIMVGPQYGTGSGFTDSAWTPMAQLTIRIPISDRLGAQDALDSARAERLRIDALLRIGELERAVLGDLAQLHLARLKADELGALADGAALAASVMARSVLDAGRGSALDAAVLELDAARARTDAVAAERDVDVVLHRLATRLGVSAERLSAIDPSVADWLPADDTELDEPSLRERLLRNQPELVRLRTDYEVAERALRLEIEQQYPDLQLGPQYNAEPGGDLEVWGLSIQLLAPLFDRNQKAIAEALAHRDEVRTRYESATRRALSELDAAQRAVTRETERLANLREQVLPLASAHAALARRAAQAGEGDALRILEIERNARRLRAEALEAERDTLTAWRRLEEAVGAALLGADAPRTVLASTSPEVDDEDVARAAFGPWEQDDSRDGTSEPETTR